MSTVVLPRGRKTAFVSEETQNDATLEQTHPGQLHRGVDRLRPRRQAYRGRFVLALIATLTLVGLAAGSAGGAGMLPVLWTAGGLDPGATGVGQAGSLTSDAANNVAVVSGPAAGRELAVSSYTPTGALRWRRTISPTSGTFQADWIVAAPNRDLVAVGHSVTSRGNAIAITLVRYASD